MPPAEHPHANTKDRLLLAGIEVIASGSNQFLRRSISVEDVVSKANLARRTFYSHFETLDDFLAEVVERLTGQTDLPFDLDDIPSAVVALEAGSPRSWITARGVLRHLGVADAHPDPTLAYFAAIVGKLAEQGRHVRPPLDDDSLAGLAALVFESCSSRAWESSVSPGTVALGVLGSMTYSRFSGEGSDPIAELRDDLRRSAALRNPVDDHPALLRLVLDTGFVAFDQRGFAEVTLDLIAKQCGLSADLIKRIFASKVACARRIVEDVTGDLALRADTAQSLLIQLSDLGIDHPSLVELVFAFDRERGQFAGDSLIRLVENISQRAGMGRWLVAEVLGLSSGLTADVRHEQALSALRSSL